MSTSVVVVVIPDFGTRWDSLGLRNLGLADSQTLGLAGTSGFSRSLAVFLFQDNSAVHLPTTLTWKKHPALLVHLLVVAVEIAQVRFETLDFVFGILDLFAEILLDVTFDGTFESSADLLQ